MTAARDAPVLQATMSRGDGNCAGRVTGAARLAVAGLVALALLAVLWELALAPLRPGGTWLALKALPALALVPGVARGSRRARQAALLALPWYAAEGIVRAFSEAGRHAVVAATGTLLAATTFVALLVWLRGERGRAP
jgi:uncharacterized membrane protein